MPAPAFAATKAGRPPTNAFSAPYFAWVWAGGLIWHLSRWGVAFLGTYLVNDLTGSPRLVQLAGTIMYAPLLVGGIAGGLISDRFNRLMTVRIQLAFLVPLSVALGLAVRADIVAVWMIYLYMFLVGIGWVTDMTSRRALVFDLVGPQRLDHAMAMESISLSLGMVLGAIVGGYAVDAVGVGSAYFFVAGFMVTALLALARVKSPPVARLSGSASPVQDMLEGIGMVRTNRAVVSVLGVTVIANMFLFAYFPIIPVVAERLGASAFLTGILAGGTGIGMLLGSMVVARVAPRRRGAVYIAGLVAALAFVIPFGLGTVYWLVLGSIIVSGFGSGFFSATQSTLVIAAAPEELRGRALGLLSMAIGGLPIGMYLLGELAEQLGTPTALVLNTGLGALALIWWLYFHPEVKDLTTDA